MSKRFVFIEDLHASEIGLDFEMGLLYSNGQIVDDLLGGMEELLLLRGKVLLEADWWKLQAERQKANGEQQQQAGTEELKAKPAPQNKRGGAPKENKAK